MLARSWDRNSVCPYVTRVRCDETKEHISEISTPRERVINLVIRYQKRLVGDGPFHLKFALKMTDLPLKNAYFDQYLFITSTVRASVKCSIIANRKSTTLFPTSNR